MIAKLPYLPVVRRRMKREIRLIRLLRKTYANWFSIWLSTVAKRKIATVRLRSNLKLHMDGSNEYVLKNLVGLAHLINEGWQILETGENHIILKEPRSTVRLKARTNKGIDLSLLDHVFVRRIYGTDFLGKTVVDAGAYIGDTAVYFAKNGAARVIGLEPSQVNFDLASENVNRLNNFGSKVTLTQAALSNEEGKADFEVFTDSPNVNKFARLEKHTIKSRTEVSKVSTITLETVMTEFRLQRINFLKINCEGAEYAILNSLTDKLASSIDAIHVEFHNGPTEIIARLERLGYHINGQTRKETMFGHLRAIRDN